MVSCSASENVNSAVVSYGKCETNPSRNPRSLENMMDKNKGIFKAPADGIYEISFTRLLKSYNGKRIWANLLKKRNGKSNLIF